MEENIRIYGIPINVIQEIALAVEGVSLMHQVALEDSPPPEGAITRVAARIKRNAAALHEDLRMVLTGWAMDGAEGIEGVEPMTYDDADDDEGEDWQAE
jgi:hypothetical protein